MAKKKEIYDYCKICGEYRPMTAEHLPPKSALNSHTAKVYQFSEAIKTLTDKNRKPWNFDGLKYNLKQGGQTCFTLCADCNSYTGANYVDYYQKEVKGFVSFLSTIDVDKTTTIKVKQEHFRPLPFIKQVLTMFASLTSICKDEDIKHFLLDKEVYDIDLKHFRIFMSVFKDGITRKNGWSVFRSNKKRFCVSEIVTFPFIFVLLDNQHNLTDEELKRFGTEITSFINYPYNQEGELVASLTINECNTMLTCDYRTKDEIIVL